MASKRPGIYGFNGPSRWLSNFYIEPDGSHVEGEYQRAKCAEAHQRNLFHARWHPALPVGSAPLEPPRICKGLGQKVKIREDWEAVKLDIMAFYVMKKFKDFPELKLKLQQTGHLHLEETNEWGDTFWGVYRGLGANALGIILMQVREELCHSGSM